MKTRLIFLESRLRPWFIGYTMPTRLRDGSMQYIGYSIENTEGDSFIGDTGTCNYFYIK